MSARVVAVVAEGQPAMDWARALLTTRASAVRVASAWVDAREEGEGEKERRMGHWDGVGVHWQRPQQWKFGCRWRARRGRAEVERERGQRGCRLGFLHEHGRERGGVGWYV